MTFNPQPKNEPIRSPKYLAWIRKCPCLACGALIGVQAAHQNFGSAGMGTKSPDIQAIPLCAHCHRAEHDRGYLSFWSNTLDLEFGIEEEYQPIVINEILLRKCLEYLNRFLSEGGRL